jgi:hypothetical protein
MRPYITLPEFASLFGRLGPEDCGAFGALATAYVKHMEKLAADEVQS